MSDRRASPSPATLPLEQQAAGLRPLLEAYDRAMREAGRGAVRGPPARRLMARRARRDLALIKTHAERRSALDDGAGASLDPATIERYAATVPGPWPKALIAGVIVVTADLIVSLTAALAAPRQLVGRAADLDLTNPLSIVLLVREMLDSSLAATMFLTWTLLVAAAIVLLPLLPGARRYRAVFCRVAAGPQRRVHRELELPPPRQPSADLLLLAVPVGASLFIGVHLFLMTTTWPVDDGHDPARIALGAGCCALFAVSAAWLAFAWWRRRPIAEGDAR